MFNPQTKFNVSSGFSQTSNQIQFPVSSNFPNSTNNLQTTSFPVSSNFPNSTNNLQTTSFPVSSNKIQFPVSTNNLQISTNNLQTTSFHNLSNSSNSINNLQTTSFHNLSNLSNSSNSINNLQTTSFPNSSNLSNNLQTTSFPNSSNLSNSINNLQTHVTFENLNNVYSLIEKQFLNMKTLSIFSESQDMKPSDLETINSVSAGSIEKLGELSIIYIKNNNSKTKLNNIFEKHLELITKIIKFNNIYSEISLNIKQLASIELTEDERRFTFVDIFYRYKLQLYEIISDINMLIAYKTLI